MSKQANGSFKVLTHKFVSRLRLAPGVLSHPELLMPLAMCPSPSTPTVEMLFNAHMKAKNESASIVNHIDHVGPLAT